MKGHMVRYFKLLSIFILIFIGFAGAADIALANEAYWEDSATSTRITETDLLFNTTQTIRLKAEVPSGKTLLAYNITCTYDKDVVTVESVVASPGSAFAPSNINHTTPGTIIINSFSTTGVTGSATIDLIDVTMRGAAVGAFTFDITVNSFGASAGDQFKPTAVPLDVAVALEPTDAYWADTVSGSQIEDTDFVIGTAQTVRLKAEVPSDKTLLAYNITCTYDKDVITVESVVASPGSAFAPSNINHTTPGTIIINSFSTTGVTGSATIDLIDVTMRGVAVGTFTFDITINSFGSSAQDQFLPTPQPMDVTITPIPPGSITGTVTYNEYAGGIILIGAIQGETVVKLADAPVLGISGDYTISDIPPGNYYVGAFNDLNGNYDIDENEPRTITAGEITVTSGATTEDVDLLILPPPTVTGLSDDATITRSKTWTWGSDQPGSEFRYLIDQDPNGVPAGDFGDVTTATKDTGDGTWYIHVQAMNGYGVVGPVTTVSVVLDNTAPVDPSIATADPAINTPTNDATVDVTWNAGTDVGGSGVEGYSWAIDKTAGTLPDAIVDAETLPSQISIGGQGDGNYYIHVRTRDNAGNWTATYHYGPWTLDRTAPSAPTLDTPTSPTNATPQEISGTKEAGTSVLNDGVVIVPLDGLTIWSYNLALVEGVNNLNLTSKDAAGNESGATSGSIELDTVNPVDPSIATAAPLINTPTNDTTVDVTWNAGTDIGGSGVAGYSWLIDRTPDGEPDALIDFTTFPSQFTIGGYGDGNYYLHVRTCDNAGNWTATYHYGPWQYETVKPMVTGVVLNPASPVKAGAVAFTVTFSEDMNQAVAPVVTFGSPARTVTGGYTGAREWQGSYTITTGYDGLQTISISGGQDIAGNVMNADTANTFVVDTTTPTVSITDPAVDTLVGSAAYTIRGDEDDGAGSGVVKVEVSIDNGANWNNATIGNSWSYNANLALGANVIKARATDAAGNVSDVVTGPTITFETDKPVVANLLLGTPGPVKAGNVDFIITFSEDMDQTVVPTVTFGDPAKTVTGAYTNATTWVGAYVIATGYDGQQTITVSGAADLAGNVMDINTAYTFVVDTTKPTVAVTDPAGNIHVTDPAYLIKGTESDGTGSGVVSVEVSIDNGVNWDPASMVNSWEYAATLAEGANVIKAKATDAAGNVSDIVTGPTITYYPPLALKVDGVDKTGGTIYVPNIDGSNTQTIVVEGGSGNFTAYIWNLDTEDFGTIGAGDADSEKVFTAAAGQTGTAQLTVTDPENAAVFVANLDIEVVTLGIDGDALIPVGVATDYEAVGAENPINWTVTDGADVAGVPVISGANNTIATVTPLKAGTFTIKAADSVIAGLGVSKTVTVRDPVTVTDNPETITVNAGEKSALFTVTGGDGSYTWAVAGPVAVPGGVGNTFRFTAPAIDSGAFAGAYTVTVTDSSGSDAFSYIFTVYVPIKLIALDNEIERNAIPAVFTQKEAYAIWAAGVNCKLLITTDPDPQDRLAVPETSEAAPYGENTFPVTADYPGSVKVTVKDLELEDIETGLSDRCQASLRVDIVGIAEFSGTISNIPNGVDPAADITIKLLDATTKADLGILPVHPNAEGYYEFGVNIPWKAYWIQLTMEDANYDVEPAFKLFQTGKRILVNKDPFTWDYAMSDYRHDLTVTVGGQYVDGEPYTYTLINCDTGEVAATGKKSTTTFTVNLIQANYKLLITGKGYAPFEYEDGEGNRYVTLNETKAIQADLDLDAAGTFDPDKPTVDASHTLTDTGFVLHVVTDIPQGTFSMEVQGYVPPVVPGSGDGTPGNPYHYTWDTAGPVTSVTEDDPRDGDTTYRVTFNFKDGGALVKTYQVTYVDYASEENEDAGKGDDQKDLEDYYGEGAETLFVVLGEREFFPGVGTTFNVTLKDAAGADRKVAINIPPLPLEYLFIDDYDTTAPDNLAYGGSIAGGGNDYYDVPDPLVKAVTWDTVLRVTVQYYTLGSAALGNGVSIGFEVATPGTGSNAVEGETVRYNPIKYPDGTGRDYGAPAITVPLLLNPESTLFASLQQLSEAGGYIVMMVSERGDGNPGFHQESMPLVVQDDGLVLVDMHHLTMLAAGPDTDGDLVNDGDDAFPEDIAASVDTDKDGKPDEWNSGYDEGDSTSLPPLVLDDDDDNDGMPDAWEELYGLNRIVDDADGDFDGDGISNIDEYNAGTDPTVKNTAPTADAGPNQDVAEGDEVTLDGSNSSDPDGAGDIVSYTWVQTEGPDVTLSDETAMQPTFTAPNVGVGGASLTFELTVTDHGDLQDTDICIVNVAWENENAPVADAGADQTVDEGETVTLDGSGSYDPDEAEGDAIATYLWEQTDGPAVTLSDETAAQPTFDAPDVDGDAVLTFRLTVSDSGGLQDDDTCIVNVTDLVPPVADAGDDDAVNEGEVVTLDASASSDADGTIVAYLWTQTDGTPVTLSDPTAVQPTFTAPGVDAEEVLIFQVTVTDDDGLQSADDVIITVSDVPPAPGSGGGCFIATAGGAVNASRAFLLEMFGCLGLIFGGWKMTGHFRKG